MGLAAGAYYGAKALSARPPAEAAPPPPVAAQNDLMGEAALASSQRAQFQLMARKGMLSTFLTSTRGVDGIAGAGLKGPPSLDPMATGPTPPAPGARPPPPSGPAATTTRPAPTSGGPPAAPTPSSAGRPAPASVPLSAARPPSIIDPAAEFIRRVRPLYEGRRAQVR